jgi:hypothetical protein
MISTGNEIFNKFILFTLLEGAIHLTIWGDITNTL